MAISFLGRGKGDAELNLVPLIDVMSVLVAFLLIYTADVELVQNARDVSVPESTAEVKPKQSVVVMITKDDVFVQGERVANVSEIRSASAPLVEPLRRVLDRPMLTGDANAEAGGREITVIADKSLPFDVVKKVMATCTATTYRKISLAVLEKDQPATARSTT